MRRALTSALILAAGLAASPAVAGGIVVPMDEVRVVEFPSAVATLFVGSTVIADVRVIDGRHAFVLGKEFGSTNVVGLDATGKQILNIPISVSLSRVASVTLQMGANQSTLSCAGSRCDVILHPDEPGYDQYEPKVAAHHDLATKSAGGQ